MWKKETEEHKDDFNNRTFYCFSLGATPFIDIISNSQNQGIRYSDTFFKARNKTQAE
jgi:hypothetical protein